MMPCIVGLLAHGSEPGMDNTFIASLEFLTLKTAERKDRAISSEKCRYYRHNVYFMLINLLPPGGRNTSIPLQLQQRQSKMIKPPGGFLVI